MKKFFGTDGIRGFVGEMPITPDFVLRLGYAAGMILTQESHLHEGNSQPAVLIGKDTRISGYMLESALQAGLSAAGVRVFLVGPMTTPGIAYLTRALRLQAGIVISASHNPYYDNGIKFFSGLGKKLPDDIELKIEEQLEKPLTVVHSDELGKAKRITDAGGRYIEFCKSTYSYQMDLRGLKIVLDCAHGATYNLAPPVFHELGANVITINNQPNGININEKCGSTQPESLVKKVLETQSDFGIAFDGDGDRVVIVDSQGKIYDGDALVYVIAKHRKMVEPLTSNHGVVGTLMTNLGIELAFKQQGIPFARAKVGDRYVLEMLEQKGWTLGGESSGHILCLDKHTTGDGIVSALQVLKAVQESRKSLAELTADLVILPQKLINVKLKEKATGLIERPEIQDLIQQAEQDLQSTGRVLLRPSGTEPVIRVMVEGINTDKVEQWATCIAEKISNLV